MRGKPGDAHGVQEIVKRTSGGSDLFAFGKPCDGYYRI